ncbi:hypothetical protein CW706_05470 [Candidatus Bathyarchaeota archaeon]|nr:MAG: hypothetical protein CW706_05470 [Candidatus Bathyarchaeota archaeon]
MDFKEVLEYYSRQKVKDEIAYYCKNRWVAIEGLERDGKRTFIRYTRRRTPLIISDSDDVSLTLNRFRFFKPRTIYASINCYRRLRSKEDVDQPSNIAESTPIWDVDASLESWEYAVKASEIIIDFLDKEGVNHSVYLKWSGRGIHIHIHEKAFSEDILKKHNPLDVAFSIVEYTLKRTKDHLVKLAEKAPRTEERPLRIENKIDIKRVFTAPLSLHRQLNLCCVCFKPNDINNFSPEWANIENPRHNSSWRKYEEGEGDRLAEKALAEVGGYDGWREAPRRSRRVMVKARVPVKTTTEASTYRKVGRFQVMGLLQAARYYIVKGNIEKAKSFGLNRAIFYAWAKRYARDRLTKIARRPKIKAADAQIDKPTCEQIGNEIAYLSPRGWFAIGRTEQLPEDYDRQIAKRIGSAAILYKDAWEASIKYLSRFSRDILLDQQRFYKEAYVPVRDRFHILVKTMMKDKKEKT